jgi:hypothetical protein
MTPPGADALTTPAERSRTCGYHVYSSSSRRSCLAANDRVIYPAWTDGRFSAIERTGIGETDVFTDVEIRG